MPKTRTCAQMVVHEWLAETQPEYRERRLLAEEQTRQSINSGEALRVAATLVTLPVVVHVVAQTAEQNISDAQVKSQIDALNRDYRLANDDKDGIPEVWRALATDANIEFVLGTGRMVRPRGPAYRLDNGLGSPIA